MIIVLAPKSSQPAALLVSAALRLSTSFSQVELISSSLLEAHQACELIIAINPDQEISEYLTKEISKKRSLKVILFGALTEGLMHLLDVAPREWPSQLEAAACS